MQSLESGSTQISNNVPTNISISQTKKTARVTFIEHLAIDGAGTDVIYQVPEGYKARIISCWVSGMIVSATNGMVALAINGKVILNAYLEENGTYDGETPMSIQFDYKTAPQIEELESVDLIVTEDEITAIGGITYVLEAV